MTTRSDQRRAVLAETVPAGHVISLSGLAADLWPRSARLESDGELSVGGVRLSALAARYDTPAYIIDEADVRYRCRTYSAAFGGAEIAYAGKAFLCRAMAGWIAQEGLSLDVCSAGERGRHHCLFGIKAPEHRPGRRDQCPYQRRAPQPDCS